MTTSIRIEKNFSIPMRDGVVLRADIYRPAGDKPLPGLVYRTPYGKHNAASDYRTHLSALERGYAVVLQDVRGRYASQGQFEPYRQEGADGGRLGHQADADLRDEAKCPFGADEQVCQNIKRGFEI